MEWLNVILDIIVLSGFGAVTLYIKNFFPSYIDEKGKNLATKEDIVEITTKTEEVQKQFKEDFERFTSDISFKYDFYYKQYSELYSKLYSIVVQSEYLRYYVKISRETHLDFKDYPFLEVACVSFDNSKSSDGQNDNSDLSLYFDRSQLHEIIISHGDMASQKLLKLAVSHRFAYTQYKDTDGNSKTSSEEEFRLMREIVNCIVREYNFLRKELRMSYNEDELLTGIIQTEDDK